MGSIYQNARALKGDMKKIEGRFRFKFSLTTENIELVLEDRIFKKTLAGKSAVARRLQRQSRRPPRPGPARQHESKASRVQRGAVRHLLSVLSLPGPSGSGDRQESSQRGRTRRAALGLDPHPAGDHSGHPSDRSPRVTSIWPSGKWSASTRSTAILLARVRSPPTSAANSPASRRSYPEPPP